MHEILIKETEFISETSLGRDFNTATLKYIIPDKMFKWKVKCTKRRSLMGHEFSFYFSSQEMEALMEAYSYVSEEDINGKRKVIEEIKQNAKRVGRVATTRQLEGIIKAAEEYCNAIRGSSVDDMILKFADIAYQPK